MIHNDSTAGEVARKSPDGLVMNHNRVITIAKATVPPNSSNSDRGPVSTESHPLVTQDPKEMILIVVAPTDHFETCPEH